jgi:ubiquinone/menaquinone biosynthesis C-methylase UbiE
MGKSPGIDSFSSKAEKYAEGRPSYPAEALDFLIEAMKLDRSMRVADVGAGTGLLTRDLKSRFNEVVAIEPNDDMRAQLNGVAGIRAAKGTAENTGLADESVNAIFSAQAFHWFEPSAAHAEFSRILKNPKPVALIWNDRKIDRDPGAIGLDKIMTRLQKSLTVLTGNEATIAEFYKQPKLNKAEFDNFTSLSKVEFRSMVLSRSYAPREGDAGYTELVAELDGLFDAHSKNGKFSVPYKTIVYWGRVSQ